MEMGLSLLTFLWLVYIINCIVDLPVLEKGENIVYRTANTKEQLYYPPLPIIQDDDDYYLSEVFDVKRGIYELIIGRYPNETANLENDWNFETMDSFQIRKLQLDKSFEESIQQADYTFANGFWESTIGVDTRTIVENTIQYPFSAVARITFTCPGLGTMRAICTASFISKNVLITAAHCLINQQTWNPIQCTDYEVSPAFQKETTPFGTVKASKIIAAPKWDKTLQNYLDSDYGLIVVDEPVGARTGWFSLGINCNDTIIPQMKTAGFPDDFKSDRNSVPNPIYNGSIMVTTTCNVTIDQCLNNEEDGSFTHVCDTAGGQSGAAMWQFIEGETEKDAVRQIRGIHVRGKGRGDANTAVYLSLNALQWIQIMLFIN